jgi:hypothetical protein
MGRKRLQLEGQQFGNWTVLEYSHYNGKRHIFKCRCLCGTEKECIGIDLWRGKSKSCGCLKSKVKTESYIGKKYGKLIIKSEAYRIKNKKFVNCICECGSKTITRIDQLISGNTKSCGCIQKAEDFTGQQLDRLSVLSKHLSSKCNAIQWNCKCSCGNIVVKSSAYLRRKKDKSCGCHLKDKTLKRQQSFIGKQFGSWLILEFVSSKNYKEKFKCRCECGTESIILLSSLQSGVSKSCGCLRKKDLIKKVIQPNVIHGYSNTPTYYSWQSMKKRCNSGRYKDKEIKICDRWIGENGFKNFFDDLGEKPNGTSLDRIDNDKGYYKENCKWSIPSDQSANRDCTIFVTYKDKTLTLSQWSKESKISSSILYKRIFQHKWDLDRAFNQKIKTKIRKNVQGSIYVNPVNSYSLKSFNSMKMRCNNKNVKDYQYYGAKGISICEEWNGKNGFKNFLKDMGLRPKNTTLNRKNPNLGYFKENCEWTDIISQNNHRNINRLITYKNKIKTMAQWAREFNINQGSLRGRLHAGWSIEKALENPIKGGSIITLSEVI